MTHDEQLQHLQQLNQQLLDSKKNIHRTDRFLKTMYRSQYAFVKPDGTTSQPFDKFETCERVSLGKRLRNRSAAVLSLVEERKAATCKWNEQLRMQRQQQHVELTEERSKIKEEKMLALKKECEARATRKQSMERKAAPKPPVYRIGKPSFGSVAQITARIELLKYHLSIGYCTESTARNLARNEAKLKAQLLEQAEVLAQSDVKIVAIAPDKPTCVAPKTFWPHTS